MSCSFALRCSVLFLTSFLVTKISFSQNVGGLSIAPNNTATVGDTITIEYSGLNGVYTWTYDSLVISNQFSPQAISKTLSGNNLNTTKLVSALPGTVNVSLQVTEGEETIVYLDTVISFLPPPPNNPCTQPPANSCQLICNGSFEVVNGPLPSCFSGFNTSDIDNWEIANSVIDPISGLITYDTPDWFSSTNGFAGCNYCPQSAASNPIGVPLNVNGNEPGYAGSNSYAGIVTYAPTSSTPNYNEKLAQYLGSTLLPNTTYTISFAVSLADESEFATDGLGIALIDESPGVFYDITDLSLRFNTPPNYPYVQPFYVEPNIITQDNGWLRISANYTTSASPTENYLVIGRFGNTANLNIIPRTGVDGCSEFAFYYIDDVSMIPSAISSSINGCGYQLEHVCPIQGVTYEWLDQNGQPLCTNCSGNQNVYPFGPAGTTNYTLNIYNSVGDIIASNQISVQNVPFPTGGLSGPPIQGPGSTCCTGNNDYFINGNFQEIIWSIDGGAITNGQGTTNAVIQWDDPNAPGTITVVTINGDECNVSQLDVEPCCELYCDPSVLEQISDAAIPPRTVTFPACPPLSQIALQSAACGQTVVSVNYPNPANRFIEQNTSWVVFNRDLIVDVDFTIRDSPFVRFAPGKKIIVQDGATLFIQGGVYSSVLGPKCPQMWGGIVLEGPNARVIFTGETAIVSAEAGVTSLLGGEYNIDGTQFIDCYVGLSIDKFAGSHPGLVKGAAFYSYQTLLPPHANLNKTFAGVVANDVFRLRLGPDVLPFNPASRNEFRRLSFGILSTATNLDVFSCDFENIGNNSSPVNTDMGIHATGSNTDHFLLRLNPTNDFQRINRFTDVGIGVRAANNMDIEANFNRINNLRINGLAGRS